MKNSDLSNPNIIYCRSCIHRQTENCPLLERIETYSDDTGFDYYFIDHAKDNGFCWLGEDGIHFK